MEKAIRQTRPLHWLHSRNALSRLVYRYYKEHKDTKITPGLELEAPVREPSKTCIKQVPLKKKVKFFHSTTTLPFRNILKFHETLGINGSSVLVSTVVSIRRTTDDRGRMFPTALLTISIVVVVVVVVTGCKVEAEAEEEEEKGTMGTRPRGAQNSNGKTAIHLEVSPVVGIETLSLISMTGKKSANCPLMSAISAVHQQRFPRMHKAATPHVSAQPPENRDCHSRGKSRSEVFVVLPRRSRGGMELSMNQCIEFHKTGTVPVDTSPASISSIHTTISASPQKPIMANVISQTQDIIDNGSDVTNVAATGRTRTTKNGKKRKKNETSSRLGPSCHFCKKRMASTDGMFQCTKKAVKELLFQVSKDVCSIFF